MVSRSFPSCGEVKGLPDPLDHQHLVLGLYLLHGVGVEALLVEGNVTRCQRASEGPKQSAAGCRNQVVERRRIRLLVLGRDAVVLGNLAMDSKEDRLFFSR